MNNQPLNKLGASAKPSTEGDRSRSIDALAASKNLALSMGQQVRSASEKVGEQAAPYIYQQSMEGFLTGLGRGFDSTANPFEGFQLSPSDDFFSFPQSGESESLLPSSAPKALSPKA